MQLDSQTTNRIAARLRTDCGRVPTVCSARSVRSLAQYDAGMLNTRAFYNNLMAIFLKAHPRLHHTKSSQDQLSSTTMSHPRTPTLCLQMWPGVAPSKKPALSLPVVSCPQRAREAVRGSVERHPPQRRHTGAVTPARHSSGGRRGLGDAGRCVPPNLLCRCAAAGGAWPWGWQGADAPLHPFAVPPPPFTPSQMPLRRSSPHLTAASQRTQALTDHFFFLPLISAAVSCRKPQVRGLLVFLFVLFLSGRDRPVGDQSLVPLTALQPKLQSVRSGMSHSAHDSRT